MGKYVNFTASTEHYAVPKFVLTHDTSKNVSKDECSNANPQHNVCFHYDWIYYLEHVLEDFIPVVKCKQLKQSYECIVQCAK